MGRHNHSAKIYIILVSASPDGTTGVSYVSSATAGYSWLRYSTLANGVWATLAIKTPEENIPYQNSTSLAYEPNYISDANNFDLAPKYTPTIVYISDSKLKIARAVSTGSDFWASENVADVSEPISFLTHRYNSRGFGVIAWVAKDRGLVIARQVLGQASIADYNGDGIVNFYDYAISTRDCDPNQNEINRLQPLAKDWLWEVKYRW